MMKFKSYLTPPGGLPHERSFTWDGHSSLNVDPSDASCGVDFIIYVNCGTSNLNLIEISDTPQS